MKKRIKHIAVQICILPLIGKFCMIFMVRSTYMHGMLKKRTTNFIFLLWTYSFCWKATKKCWIEEYSVRFTKKNRNVIIWKGNSSNLYKYWVSLFISAIFHNLYILNVYLRYFSMHITLFQTMLKNDNRESSFNHIGEDFIYFLEISVKIFFFFSFYIIHILSQMHSNSTDSQ